MVSDDADAESPDGLVALHRALEERIAALDRHVTLSPDEQLERQRLKKEKLALKDRMAAQQPAGDAKGDIVGDTAAETSDAERAALIKRLRVSGIRVDREGELWHEGEVVRHLGLRSALFRWMDRLPPSPDGTPGRYILRLDERRFVYLDVDDTPLVVRALRWAGDEAMLALSDGSEERLSAQGLSVDEAGVLRCLVRDGRLEARLSTSAAAVLAERVEEQDGRLALRTAGEPTAIPLRAAIAS